MPLGNVKKVIFFINLILGYEFDAAEVKLLVDMDKPALSWRTDSLSCILLYWSCSRLSSQAGFKQWTNFYDLCHKSSELTRSSQVSKKNYTGSNVNLYSLTGAREARAPSSYPDFLNRDGGFLLSWFLLS